MSKQAQNKKKNEKTHMTCCACGCVYLETRKKVSRWAESGKPYDPTDWVCPRCKSLGL